MGQQAPGVQGQAMAGRLGLKDLVGSRRALPVVLAQRDLHPVHVVVQGGLGEIQAVEQAGAVLGDHHHSLGPRGPIAFEHLAPHRLASIGPHRIADQERAAPGVVADDRL